MGLALSPPPAGGPYHQGMCQVLLQSLTWSSEHVHHPRIGEETEAQTGLESCSELHSCEPTEWIPSEAIWPQPCSLPHHSLCLSKVTFLVRCYFLHTLLKKCQEPSVGCKCNNYCCFLRHTCMRKNPPALSVFFGFSFLLRQDLAMWPILPWNSPSS
jgi:hypothetical protein